MSRRIVGALLASATVGAAGETAGQNVATSLEQLAHSKGIRVGQGIHITMRDGVRLKGEVRGVSVDRLEVSDGGGTRTFAEDEIRRIEMQDSWANGAWLGLGVGVGVAFGACATSPDGACPYALVSYGYPAMLVGTVVGAVVDASIRRTVLEVEGVPAPAVGIGAVWRGGVGVAVTAAW